MSSWLKKLHAGIAKQIAGSRPRQTRHRPCGRTTLALEALENRLVPASISLGTDGVFTLTDTAADVTVTSLGGGQLGITVSGDTIAAPSGPSGPVSGITGLGPNSLTITAPLNGLVIQSGGSIRVNAAGGTGVSTKGAISLTGQGDAANPVGVTIDHTTLNANGGNITLIGHGFNGPSFNNAGVLVNGGQLLTNSATLYIEGHGGGTGNNEDGVDLWNGAVVSDAGGGAVTIYGNASTQGKDGNFGVCISDASNTAGPSPAPAPTHVGTADGSVSISGYGGGSGQWNYGVAVSSEATVGATGTGSVSLYGFGGRGTNYDEGVYITGMGTTLSTGAGMLIVWGWGEGSAYGNYGVTVANGAHLSTASGRMEVQGFGSSAGSDANFGVNLTDLNTQVTTKDGTLHVGGSGGGTGSWNYGIGIQAGAVVQATGSGSVSLTGNGSSNSSGTMDDGIYLSGGSVSGNAVTATGNSGGSGFNAGIALWGSSVAGQSSVTLQGGGTGSTVYGVELMNSSTVRSGGGTVQLTGTGSGTFAGDGVAISNGSSVFAQTGIQIQGRGTLDGVWISGSTVEQFMSGVLSIEGTGGQQNVFGGSTGVVLTGGARVEADVGSVLLSGSGITYGVEVDGGFEIPGYVVPDSWVAAPNGHLFLLAYGSYPPANTGVAIGMSGFQPGIDVAPGTFTATFSALVPVALTLQDAGVFSTLQADLARDGQLTPSDTQGLFDQAVANNVVSQQAYSDLSNIVEPNGFGGFGPPPVSPWGIPPAALAGASAALGDISQPPPPGLTYQQLVDMDFAIYMMMMM
jgi:hypothetical protein